MSNRLERNHKRNDRYKPYGYIFSMDKEYEKRMKEKKKLKNRASNKRR